MEVLYRALFLGESQELLADRFDEGGGGMARLEVLCGAGRVTQPRALKPSVGEVPRRS